jgi:hypothetical protein
LEQSGFISSYIPFGKKKKDTLYRLTDFYSLFYLQFIKDLSCDAITSWVALSQTKKWIYWSGYAFENICLNHIDKIKKSLGISGVVSNQYGFIVKATDISAGTQIDLIIDRHDQVISLCEMKFYKEKYQLS